MKISVVVGIGAALIACTPGQRETARTALDFGQALCVVAKQALPDTEVADQCGIVAPFFGPMRELLSGARAASAQAVAGARVAAVACTTEKKP